MRFMDKNGRPLDIEGKANLTFKVNLLFVNK